MIFGGLSATYFAEELIRYPAVDIVVQGYDTLEPVRQLVQTVRDGRRNLGTIPNLVYRRADGSPVVTGYTYQPQANYNDVAVD